MGSFEKKNKSMRGLMIYLLMMMGMMQSSNFMIGEKEKLTLVNGFQWITNERSRRNNWKVYKNLKLSKDRNPFQYKYLEYKMKATINPKETNNSIETIFPKSNLNYLILWRGEGVKGYSHKLRQLEFCNAISSIFKMKGKICNVCLHFEDALCNEGFFSESEEFNSAIQYISFEDNSITTKDLIEATKRCSLVRSIYQILAYGKSYNELAINGLDSPFLQTLNGTNQNATWCIRLRDYQDIEGIPRFGRNVKSPLARERQAIYKMKDLVNQFGGKVDLSNPDIKLYILEGLLNKNKEKMLAIRLAEGPKISMYAPNTRICITTTPLDPIAAFSMCNIAQIFYNSTVLDPFCGSCSTLLAATHIAGIGNHQNNVQTVGIELAHGKYVNFDHVIEDFTTRNLKPPVDLIRGDCMDYNIRQKARASIDNQSFDVIITDPPYGIRESMDSSNGTPLIQFLNAMIIDQHFGTPLLKPGGRMVVFVPVMEGETLFTKLPDTNLLNQAGLKMIDAKEQFLSRILSRWMVVFTCQN